jgi:hypothetical protein
MKSSSKIYLNVEKGIEELRTRLFAVQGRQRQKLLEQIEKLQSGKEICLLQFSVDACGEKSDVLLIAPNAELAKRLLDEAKKWATAYNRKAKPGKYLRVVKPGGDDDPMVR